MTAVALGRWRMSSALKTSTDDTGPYEDKANGP